MANPIHTPPTPVSSPVEPRLDYDNVPETGVRRYEDPLAAPGVAPASRVRWGAVVAGLVIAAASQLLLGMLGVAIGLTAVDAADANPWRALGTGMGSECTDLRVEGGHVVGRRPLFAGKLYADVRIDGKPALFTVRPNSFPQPTGGSGQAEVERVEATLRPKTKVIERKAPANTTAVTCDREMLIASV